MLKALLFVSLGILLGVLFCNWSYFKIDSAIQITDLFCLLITSVVGLHIADKIQNRLSSSRSEKDFLIAEIKDFKSELNKIKNFNDRGSYDFNESKLLFKDLNQSLTQIENILSISSYKKKATEELKSIRDNFRKIRNRTLNILPINGTISIPNYIKLIVDKEINEIKKTAYELIIKINRL